MENLQTICMFRNDDKTTFQDMSVKKFTKTCLKKQLYGKKAIGKSMKKHFQVKNL